MRLSFLRQISLESVPGATPKMIHSRFRSIFITAFTAVLFGAASAFAQTDRSAISSFGAASASDAAGTKSEVAASTTAGAGLQRIGVQTSDPVPLSIDEAIRKALSNNNSIEIARDDVRFQETQIRGIRGFYDPVFTITPTYTRNSITGSNATNDFSINANVVNFIQPGGGNYQAFFNNTRTENAFAQAQVSSGSIGGSSTSAIYSSSWGVRYTQPLFRNFNIDANRRSLKIAKRRLEQTDADFRRQTIDTIANVQRSYWDLVFALRDQQNRQANLDLTRESLRQVLARISAGAAAPLARWEVETELANRESDVLVATQQVSIAENALKQLLLRDAASPEWSRSYVPTDQPTFSVDAISLDAAVKSAMENRFELRRLKLASDINQIDISYFKNQTKPQIDLNTTFSFNGLARGGASTDSVFIRQFNGNDAILLERLNTLFPMNPIPNPVVEVPGTPTFLAGGFGRSIFNTFRTDAPNYTIGVTISLPFRNRTARANLAGANVQQSQIETQTRQQEQIVIVEVRNAVQSVETARQRVLTARRARENAEKQLEGERVLFESGKSTTFLLFQRENTLANARNAEIRAETDYSKAVADLQRATSTTFQINNIQVDSPATDK